MKNSNLRNDAMFYINELKYDGAKRGDIIATLMETFEITKANAGYYVDRVAKAA